MIRLEIIIIMRLYHNNDDIIQVAIGFLINIKKS